MRRRPLAPPTALGLASSSGNGTGTIDMTGKLAAIDAALDGLEYFPNSDITGNDSLNLSLTDSAAQQTTTAGVELSISPAVPEPSFSLGPDQAIPTGVGQQTISGWATGMTAGLPDGSTPPLSFVVNVVDGALLFSVLPAIDAAGDLSYTPEAGARGTATFSVQLEASPPGGPNGISYASQFTITIGSGGLPQLVAPTSEFIPENGVLVLGSSDTGGGIYVGGDTDTSAQVQVTVGTTWGTFTYTDASGNTYSGETTETISGTIDAVNADLATLVLEPASNSSGSGTLTVSLYSTSTGSQGGVVSAADTIPLTIVGSGATSSDISVSMPSDQGAPEGQWFTFSGDTGNAILINADPTADAIVTITASNGYLSIGSTDGNDDSFATLTGTVADINTELDGLGFAPINSGTAQLTVTAMLVNGSGEPLSAPTSASISIEVREAPYFNAYLGLWLNDQPQYSGVFYTQSLNDSPVLGTTISDILYPQVGSLVNPDGEDPAIGSFDPSSGPQYGIAITGLDTQDGTWQYSPDWGGPGGDSDWQTIGAVSDTKPCCWTAGTTAFASFPTPTSSAISPTRSPSACGTNPPAPTEPMPT